MRKVRIISSFMVILSLILCMTACSGGKNSAELLCNTWYKETLSPFPSRTLYLTIYNDGTYKQSGQYGTGKWSIVNDNQLKLTDYYGQSDTYTIDSVSADTLVLSGKTYYSTAQIDENSLKEKLNEYTQSNNSKELSETTSAESSAQSLTEINPFEKLNITYTGASPYITVSTDSTLCDETVNKYITFKIDNDNNLKNGDTFTITAVYDEYKLKTNGFSIANNSKTYTVENQPEFIKTVDGLDLTSMQAEMNDKLAVVTANNEGSSHFAGVYIGGNAGIGYGPYKSIASKKLKSTYLISLKNSFEDKYNRKPYNCYMQIYEYTINKYDEKNPTQKIYVMIYVNNIYADNDKSLSWDVEIGSVGYDNYDNLINERVTSQREFYNVTEIKT